MAKYRKKPVVIEAVQFTEAMARCDAPPPDGVELFGDHLRSPLGQRHYIETLEGQMRVSIGDFVITGVKGERYPCKPDIFEATYEACE